MAEQPLNFWFHFGCPYCYLSWESLRRAIAGSSFVVEAIPLEYENIDHHLVRECDKFSTSRWERLTQKAKLMRLTIQPPPRTFSHSTPLSRTAIILEGEKRSQFIDLAFQAIFAKGISPTDVAGLVEFFQESGFDVELFRDAQENPAAFAQIKNQAERWKATPLLLLPHLEFSGENLSGSMDQKGIERFFSALPI